ncbi:hypothetical protein [Rhodoferax sp.]
MSSQLSPAAGGLVRAALEVERPDRKGEFDAVPGKAAHPLWESISS